MLSKSTKNTIYSYNQATSLLRLTFLLTIMSVLTKTGRLGFGGRIFVNGFAWNRHHHRTAAFRTQSMALSSATTDTPASPSTNSASASANTSNTKERLFSEEINVLYDSKCGVCKLEMEWLQSRDIKLHGPDNRKLKLTDLEDDFDSTDPSNGSIDYATGMAAIYAIKHDGTIYKGVPVFEVAYDQVGLGWIWKINQVPAINRFLEWGYEIFATNRTRITRGASLSELLALHAAKKKMAAEEDCESCNSKIKQQSE